MNENKHTVARSFGVLFALALTGLLIRLSVASMDMGNSYGGITLLFALILIGGPLLVVTAGITIYLAVKSAIGPGLAALMWLPIVVSLAIVPVTDYFAAKKRMREGTATVLLTTGPASGDGGMRIGCSSSTVRGGSVLGARLCTLTSTRTC